MKLQQLEVLLHVVEHGGIRAASRQLHLSQAAVTKSMRLLEDEAGVPLLIRRSRGVGLTDAGERLLARARLISRQVALARDDLLQAGGEDAGSVRLGVTPFLTLSALGPAFDWFRQRFRKVDVTIIEGLMARVVPRLRDGTLDIAAVAADVGELRDDEFRSRRILRSPQRIVARAGHPVLAEPSPAALAAYEWVLTPPASGDHAPRLAALFAAAGGTPPARVVLCETLAAMTILRHSDAISIFPEPLLGHPESRGIVPVDRTPLAPSDIELLLLTHPEVPLTPAAEYFAHCLAAVCARLPTAP